MSKVRTHALFFGVAGKIVIGATYVLGRGITLQVRLDGLVLLVEEGQIRDEILDDVGVRQWVDARLGVGLSGDTA